MWFSRLGFAIFDKYNGILNAFSLFSLSALFYRNWRLGLTIQNSRSLQVAVALSLFFGLSPFLVDHLNQPALVQGTAFQPIKFRISGMR
jgi:hypothetical protein